MIENLVSLAVTLANTGKSGTESALSEESSWSILNLFTNAGKTVQTIGSALLVLLGIVMIVVAGVKIAKALMSNGQGQPPNWIMIIALLIVGGAFAVGGFSLISQIAAGGQQTIKDLGGKGNAGGEAIQNAGWWLRSVIGR